MAQVKKDSMLAVESPRNSVVTLKESTCIGRSLGNTPCGAGVTWDPPMDFIPPGLNTIW